MVVLVIVIALFSITVFTQFDWKPNSPVAQSTTLSTSTTSSTQQESTSSSDGRTPFLIGFSQNPNSLFATPGVKLNYTVVISQLDTTARHVTLSATSTVPGVTLAMNPNEFTFLGTQEAVALGISVAPTVNSSILPVEITASTLDGETNSTFQFTFDKALIVVLDNGESRPPTLQVSVGQTVTWLDLVDPSDENAGCVALVDGSTASPTMDLNDVWSHTFDKPGTYRVQVIASGCPLVPGVVIVA